MTCVCNEITLFPLRYWPYGSNYILSKLSVHVIPCNRLHANAMNREGHEAESSNLRTERICHLVKFHPVNWTLYERVASCRPFRTEVQQAENIGKWKYPLSIASTNSYLFARIPIQLPMELVAWGARKFTICQTTWYARVPFRFRLAKRSRSPVRICYSNKKSPQIDRIRPLMLQHRRPKNKW